MAVRHLRVAAARRNGHSKLRQVPASWRLRSKGLGGSPGDSVIAPRVEQGDAFDLLETLQPRSIDLVLTSPPYWGLRTYELGYDWGVLDRWIATGKTVANCPPYDWYRENGGILGLEPTPDWYVAHLVEILDRARRVLKPGGNVWVNLGDTYFARWSSIRDRGRQGLGENPRLRRRTPMGGYRQEKQLLMIPARFAIAMQERRWILRNDLIWFKPNVPPRPERDRLRMAHEHFFHFVLRPTQGRATYHYDLDEVEPQASDVVTCNVRAGENGHSATFPKDLIEPRIRSSCPPGGIVLDPFCGTGRTLVVAVANGRGAIGFEIMKDFAASARQSLEAAMASERVL